MTLLRKPCAQCKRRLTTERFCDTCRGKLAIAKPCAGCRAKLTKQHYCDACYAKKKDGQPDARPSARARGYGTLWQKRSKLYLQRHPLCVHCEADGIARAATLVDHITPHRGDPSLFWDEGNWQSLCKHHHAVKTGRERAAIRNRKERQKRPP